MSSSDRLMNQFVKWVFVDCSSSARLMQIKRLKSVYWLLKSLFVHSVIYSIMSWNDRLLWAFLSRNALVWNRNVFVFSGTFGYCDQVSELWWYESLPNLQRQRAVHEVLCSGETPQTCDNWVWIILIIHVLVAWFSEGIRCQCYIPLIINYHMHMAWYL